MIHCPCGHGVHRVPQTRWQAIDLARHQDKITHLLAVVESDREGWLRVLRCTRCGRFWAEDSMSSGHADLFYIYPIQTTEPRSWLADAQSLSLPPGEKPTLRFIGYWAGKDDTGWPDPAAFVDPTASHAVQRRVIAYLRAGTMVVAAAGLAPCRLCGIPNGSAQLTDGTHLMWPDGLAHYVEEHDVRLPDVVVALMDVPPAAVDVRAFARDVFQAGRIVVDYDWWRSLST